MSRHFPDLDTFHKLAHGVELVPVYRRLMSDTLTPVSAFQKIDAGVRVLIRERDRWREGRPLQFPHRRSVPPHRGL
ncbi:MAG: hypothetical protein R3C10_19330 [Pirellulales bacterium]